MKIWRPPRACSLLALKLAWSLLYHRCVEPEARGPEAEALQAPADEREHGIKICEPRLPTFMLGNRLKGLCDCPDLQL